MRTRDLFLTLGLALAACGGGTASGPAPGAPAARGATLFVRLGGLPAITAVVDEFVARVAADERINMYFFNTDVPRLKQMLVDQICNATGGPCQYTGRDMITVHAGMKVTDADWDATVEDLVGALDQFKVPAAEKTELLTALSGLKPQIVGR